MVLNAASAVTATSNAFGSGAIATGINATAIGEGANAATENSVALGAGSTITLDPTAAANALPRSGTVFANFTIAENNDAKGEANLGNRLVTGVADGRIDATSSDAVNGSQLYQVATQVDTNATDIANLDTRVTTNETNIAKNTTDIASNATKIADNATDIATNKANITSNTTRITTNENAITNLDARVTTNEGAIAKNVTDISDLDTRVTTNESAIATNKTNIATNAADIAVLQKNSCMDAAATTSFACGEGAGFGTATEATAVGDSAQATANGATAMGYKSEASGENSAAVGQGAQATHENAIALGAGSITTLSPADAKSAYNGTVIGTNVTLKLGTDATGEANLGNRLVTGIADGRVAAGSSDAVNGHQLYQVASVVDSNTTRIVKNETDIANLDTRVTVNEGNIANNTALLQKHGDVLDNHETRITNLEGKGRQGLQRSSQRDQRRCSLGSCPPGALCGA
ncbi:MAG: hypothetical protein ACR2OR_05880 [Hyphomicrobiales bacterium]